MNYEEQYIKESGDKKPVYHNNFADYHYLIKEWFERYTKWLSARLERIERLYNDFCEQDVELRKILEPILGEEVFGNPDAVPPALNLIEVLVKRLEKAEKENKWLRDLQPL